MRIYFAKRLMLAGFIALFLVTCTTSTSTNNQSIQVSLTKVFKYDNSLQCESEGISLEDMQIELSDAGVQIVCSQKGNDGFARITVCGAATGRINIYQIPTSSLDLANSLGFMDITNLSDYQDSECIASSE